MIGSDRPVLSFALLLVFGLVGGALAKRAKLPSVTGQIAMGVLLGPAVLHLFSSDITHSFQGLTEFALALISVSVGSHLPLRRLRHAGRRLGFLAVADTGFTMGFVFLAAWGVGGVPWPMALVLAAIAVETSPGTVLSVIRETRSKGVFVQTLVAAVAMSDVACIVMFEMARAAGHLALGADGAHGWDLVVSPLKQLSMAVGIGGACGLGYLWVSRRLEYVPHIANASLLAVLFAWGLAHLVDVSSILACVFLGVILANFSRSKGERSLHAFASFEPAIFAVFFTLAGLHLEFQHLAAAGVLAILVFVARSAGKITGARLALKFAGTTGRLRRYLGMAMLPHASIAVGLMLLIREDPAFASMSSTILAVGISVVALSEVFGPIAARYALSQAEEIGKAKPRLLDFLQEADIITGFRASSKQDAIVQMVRHLARSHQVPVDERRLVASVMEREAEMSTCLGGGLMIPHAELPEGERILGVMALAPQGLDFETADDQPVRCVVLLATPASQRDRHLEVLAALSRALGFDLPFRDRLFQAKTPAHAAELLHAQETETFNYFFGEDGAEGGDRGSKPPSGSDPTELAPGD